MALVTNEKIEGEYGPADYYLADLQTFPGHSGGPVWSIIGQFMFLVGVMAGGFPAEQDTFIQTQQTGTVVHTTTIETYARLGISLITPVERLQELLMSAHILKERDDRMKSIAALTAQKPIATGNTVVGQPRAFTKDDFEKALKKVSRKQSDEGKK